jgi:membrane associated rhomboid family serine protease
VLSLIPISDVNPARRKPFVTWGLIALNLFFFFQTPGLGQSFEGSEYFFEEAPIPCQLQGECPDGVQFGEGGPSVPIPERTPLEFFTAIVFSTFLHAGFMHIAGNMLFLWIFGNNIEDHLGHFGYLLFYLVGGIAASMAHVLTHADDVIPSVGASGAVAAVMGAYILLFPKAKVKVLLPIFIIFTIVQMPAVVVLALWFAYQFFIGAQEFARGGTEVAWMAHVGGFAFGLVAIFLLGGRPQRPPSLVQRQDWRRY